MDASSAALNVISKELYEMFQTKNRNVNFAEGLLAELRSINSTLIILTKEVGAMNLNLKAIQEKTKP